MKNVLKISLVLFSLLLLARPSLAAGKNAQLDAFDQCVLSTLVYQFEAHHGNRYAYTASNLAFAYLKGDPTTPESTVLFVPAWSSHSDQFNSDGMKSWTEQILNMEARGYYSKYDGDTGMDISYSRSDDSSSDPTANSVSAVMTIPHGLPYMTADRKVTEQCQTDQYGHRLCDPKEYAYSNFQVVTPKNYQSTTTWVNKSTGLNTQFQLNVDQYRACLQSIR